VIPGNCGARIDFACQRYGFDLIEMRFPAACLLDENCGAGSWAMTPSGNRGVLK
jgi:hypothetical protein